MNPDVLLGAIVSLVASLSTILASELIVGPFREHRAYKLRFLEEQVQALKDLPPVINEAKMALNDFRNLHMTEDIGADQQKMREHSREFYKLVAKAEGIALESGISYVINPMLKFTGERTVEWAEMLVKPELWRDDRNPITLITEMQLDLRDLIVTIHTTRTTLQRQSLHVFPAIHGRWLEWKSK